MLKKNADDPKKVRLFRRKVLKLNNSFYISLPKPWAEQNKVEKGEFLALIWGKELKVVKAE